MKITKLFKLICLLPILVGCNQTPVPEKEQLIIPTYYFDDSNPMPEELDALVKEKRIAGEKSRYKRYDVTPNELRGLFTLYATKEREYPDVILYKGELHPIAIQTTSGFATFAYYKGDGKELIYYAACSGSTFVHVNVGVLNLKTMQEKVADIKHEKREYLYSDDYYGLVFKSFLKDDKLQLQAYKLELEPFDPENPMPTQYKQTDLLYEDLFQYELVAWEEYSYYEE